MGIAERLIKIIRSNLNDLRHSSTPSPNQPQESEPLWDDPSPAPQQDPKLAQYYANLELPYGADLDAVKAGWKQLLKRYHPDLYGQDEASRKTAEEITRGLNHAYFELEKHLKSR